MHFSWISVILVVVVAIGSLIYFTSNKSGDSLLSNSEQVVESNYVVPPLGETYRNDKYQFSLTLPEGFKANEFTESNGVETIVLEDNAANGIQISVSPFDEDLRELTPDMILEDIPDLAITDPQPVEIGQTHQGLAFLSDNGAFDGSSREVWFVFNGHLYQISTYAHLDELLRTMFTTWRFE